jgi:hypothetical protein
MQRDLVVILYGSIYTSIKLLKYNIANIIKLSELGTILSSVLYRRWEYTECPKKIVPFFIFFSYVPSVWRVV